MTSLISGPEPEFFVFDDVRFKNEMNETSFSIDSSEGPYNTPERNMKMETWDTDQELREVIFPFHL